MKVNKHKVQLLSRKNETECHKRFSVNYDVDDEQNESLDEYMHDDNDEYMRNQVSEPSVANSIKQPDAEMNPLEDFHSLNPHLKYPSLYDFSMLKFYLDTGMSVLIYGVGSKYEFLKCLIETELSSQPCLIVNGYHTNCSLKRISSLLSTYIPKEINMIGHKGMTIKDIDLDGQNAQGKTKNISKFI